MKKPSDKERVALMERVNERAAIIQTGVAAIVGGYQPAMFIWGPPGLGKTRMLTTLLDGLAGKTWRHHTAYSTPKALMLTLAEDPNAIHLFEDCEALLKVQLSASILRAACGAPGERQRWVTYETNNVNLRCNFQGGVIIATNANLAKGNGPLQGVASRFRPICWNMTTEERVAGILTIAQDGWIRGKTRVTPKDAIKVANALFDMLSDNRIDVELDIRLFTEHALPAFAHAQATGQPEIWQDVLLAKLTGTASTVTEAREEKTQRLQTLALQIHAMGTSTKDRVERWKAATGLGPAIFYRHLREAKAQEKNLTNEA